MAGLVARAMRRATLTQVRRVGVVTPPGDGLVAEVYRRMETDFGMLAPPIALHAAAPLLLAGAWCVFRETMLPVVRVERVAKEAVATAVSRSNRCPYCVEVHETTLAGLAGPDEAGTLARWAREGGESPFAADQGPELIGTAVVFHYLNRMVNVFVDESPLARTPGLLRPVARRGAQRLMGALTRPIRRPGTSLDLLPPASGRPAPAWAADQPHIADALRRTFAVVDAEADRLVPTEVRALVTHRIADADPGPGLLDARQWLERRVNDLPVDCRAAGRLALLTVWASYRVTDELVAEVRRGHDDATVLTLTAWAGWQAARDAGEALAAGRRPDEPIGPDRERRVR
jgi:AhpD family alkylhydroperoxidase